MKPLFHIVLYCPEIPGNTGSIGRTCVALNLHLHLIHPIGFDLSEKAVRRAGLDYWKYLKLSEYDSWTDFLKREQPKDIYLFSRFAQNSPYFQASFSHGCYLVFGSESRGLPLDIVEMHRDQTLALPTYSDKIRSLNLANTVTAASYEVLRQLQFS
jgi:tRNA (cytidine/uridine-2'-O-)-methyltransferase